jgi:two-component system chemotaxis sensor kinase CheA
MERDNSEFEKKLLLTFRGEAEGHLNAIVAGLLELEKPLTPERHAAVVESVFRETHTLKGAARSVSLADIEETCQALENIFSAVRHEEITLSRETFDLLHQSVSLLEIFLKGTETEIKAVHKKSREIIQNLTGIAQGAAPALVSQETTGAVPEPAPPAAAEPGKPGSAIVGPQADTIRIATARLDSLMLRAEELGEAKRAAAQRSSDLGGICRQFGPWKRRWTGIRARLPALRRSTRYRETHTLPEHKQTADAKIADFLEYSAEFVHTLESELARQNTLVRADHQFLADRTDNLINDMKELLMMPAGFMLESFPRIVREFSRDKKKEVDLIIGGEEILIDRRILDEMKDAFMHMVRNAIDHGIELPEIRVGRGKAPSGTIAIRFTYRDGKNVEIIMEDDGAGIDSSSVGAAALREGILTREELDHLSGQELLPLVFRSGVTTSRIITDSSGRGLGLAIAMEKVDRLGGSIEVTTTPGKGTRFRILLPLTLATFKGLVVSESKQTFVVPLQNVERVLRVRPETIKTVEGQMVIERENEPLALVRLADALGIPRAVSDNEPLAISIVVIVFADKRLGISVDEIGYTQDVMVKGLGKHLMRVKNFASATVLGTGKVVPVVNVGDLMKSAISIRSGGAASMPAPAGETARKKKSVLVTEDSITSRMLLKNILEGAGYIVETAVDGMDAFTKLRSGSFDIVVSDVDMPRMNGFVLTEKIRVDKKYAELPVVLVTALDSPADRERGIDVGANAYIVKSSFDQSNLLEVVQRLIGT